MKCRYFLNQLFNSNCFSLPAKKWNETCKIDQRNCLILQAARIEPIVFRSLPSLFVHWQLIKALQISIPRRIEIILKWLKWRVWYARANIVTHVKWSNGEIFPCKNKTKIKRGIKWRAECREQSERKRERKWGRELTNSLCCNFNDVVLNQDFSS